MNQTLTPAGIQQIVANKTAIIHQMVMPRHICPYGLKALDLLKRKGFTVEDRWLTTREETDAFKGQAQCPDDPTDLHRQ